MTSTTRLMMIPVFYLLVLSLMFVICIKTGYSKVSDQNALIKSLKTQNNTLTEKDNILRGAQSEISTYFKASGYALPSTNPVLVSLAQVKNLASEYLLPLEETKVSGFEAGGGAGSSVKITLKTTGEVTQILSFIKAFSTITPLTVVDKMEMANLQGEALSVSLSLFSYWQESPTKLPNYADPIKKISDRDMTALTKMAQLEVPTFSNLSPVGPYERTNPFN